MDALLLRIGFIILVWLCLLLPGLFQIKKGYIDTKAGRISVKSFKYVAIFLSLACFGFILYSLYVHFVG